MKRECTLGPHQAVWQIGSHIFIQESRKAIKLLGSVVSEQERGRAAMVAAALVPRKALENQLEVDPNLRTDDVEPSAEWAASGDQEDDLLSVDSDDEDSDLPYFPATDPVISVSDGKVEILGGFAATSMDETPVEVSADGQVGDEALADAVRLELRADAATTDLSVTVNVRDGIVYLHGTVLDLLDSDNAVEVASRVPWVDEVIDLLTVSSLG